MCLLCRSLFALLFLIPLVILLYVLLRNTDYDYSFCIFIPFLLRRGFYIRPFDHRSMTLSPFVLCGPISGHFEKGISNGLSPIYSFICTRQTSYSGFQRKTMYWTLREWYMSNLRKCIHFILIRRPKWRSGDKAISSWMKMKKIKIVRIEEDTTKQYCLCAYNEQIEDEFWFCLLFYLGHSWKTGTTLKCVYALILISSTFLFMV